MAPHKPEPPAVVTYADYEVITPPNVLRKAVSDAPHGADDPVGRAEEALAQLSGEFAGWMDAECRRLDEARHKVRAGGLVPANRIDLFRAAHDIKGEAATFGYPFAGVAAESLCRLIEHTPDTARIPIALIDQHVDAVRAIIREHGRPDAPEVARALTARLRQVTEDFLVRENEDRPGYMESVSSPSIAAGE